MKIATLFLVSASVFLLENSASAQSPGSFSSLTANAGLTVTGKVTFNSADKDFTVEPSSVFNGTSTFNGASTFNGNTTVTKPLTANDFVYLNGGLNGGTVSPNPSGSTFLWYSRKAALRAGYTDNSSWNDSAIGYMSVALGYDSTASATGSTALSSGTATGVASFAGANSMASGLNAFSYGQSAIASGQNSFALGRYVDATTFSSFVIGQYAEDLKVPAAGGETAWVPEDPLFVVGNGTSATERRNALAIYKDGTIIMTEPQGDISMGQYGN